MTVFLECLSSEQNDLLSSLFVLFVQSVMEQFNPGLRNLVNLGKNYEKSVAGEYLDPRCHFTLKLNVGLAI